MELMLEVIYPPPSTQEPALTRLFRQAGGVIGRAADCDWVLPDRQRIISGRHAQVSYSDEASISPTPAATVSTSKAMAVA